MENDLKNFNIFVFIFCIQLFYVYLLHLHIYSLYAYKDRLSIRALTVGNNRLGQWQVSWGLDMKI